MIRFTSAVSTAAILLALLSVSCSKTKASTVQKNDSQSSSPPGLQTPAPQKQRPPTPLTATPSAPPVAEFVSKFSGEVSRGQTFERIVAPGMVFRLEPYAGNDSGWDMRLAPDIEPSPASAASADCIGAVLVPSHGSNELSIELPQEETDQGAALRDPHEFDFVPNSSDCKRAWDLSNSLAYRPNLTDQEREELDRQLSEIPTAHGQLKVLDFRLSRQSERGKPSGIEWIKFEVELQFPQRERPRPFDRKMHGE